MKLNLKKRRVKVQDVVFELEKLTQADFTTVLGHAVRLNGGSLTDVGQAFPRLITDKDAMADVMTLLRSRVKLISGLTVEANEGERPGTMDDLTEHGGVEGLGLLASLLPHLLTDNMLTEVEAKN